MSAQIFPIVGATEITLPDPLPTQDVSDGTPGSPVPATAMQVAGSDGTDLRTLSTDTTGRQVVVGAAANGGVLAGNPVLVAGSDGTDARSISTDTAGKVKVDLFGNAGVALDAAPGATAPTNALQVGGVDYNGKLQAISTDTLGRQQVVGANSTTPAIIQGGLGAALTNTGVNQASLAKAYTNPVKVGNTLVVICARGVVNGMSISDTLNLHWQCAQVASNSLTGISFAFFARVTVAGTPTVTITPSANDDLAMVMYEIEGAGAVDTLGIGAGNAAVATSSVTCPTQTPFGLSFASFASASGGTISAASPVTPANASFDSASLAIAGASVLKNFGVFSAPLSPIIQTNTNATTANLTTFKAAIATSASCTAMSCTFRPMASQITLAGQVEVPAGTASQGVVLPVATLHSSPIADGTPAANCEPMFNVLGVGQVFPAVGPMIYNGGTWDRVRSVILPNTNTASNIQNVSPGLAGVGVLSGPAGAIVQSKSSISANSVASLTAQTVDVPNTGNTMIVVCAVGNATAPTVTDNNTVGTTYKLVASQLGPSSAFGVYVFQGVYTKSNNGVLTVTVNNGGTTASIAMMVYEVAGLLAISQQQPDATSTNSGTSATASSNAVLPQYANEIAFAGVALGTANQTITPATGWINDSGQLTPTGPAGLFSLVSMSQFLPDFQEVTPQATFTSEPWAIACATFRPMGVTVAGKVSLNGSLYTLQPSQVSGVANATTTRASLTGLGSFENLDILINITGAGATTGTLQLYIQDSADGGTTWDDLVSSNTFAFGASVVTQRFFITGDITTSATQGSAAVQESLTAGTVRNGPWGDRLRVREKVSGVSGSPTGATYTITLVAKHG